MSAYALSDQTHGIGRIKKRTEPVSIDSDHQADFIYSSNRKKRVPRPVYALYPCLTVTLALLAKSVKQGCMFFCVKRLAFTPACVLGDSARRSASTGGRERPSVQAFSPPRYAVASSTASGHRSRVRTSHSGRRRPVCRRRPRPADACTRSRVPVSARVARPFCAR